LTFLFQFTYIEGEPDPESTRMVHRHSGLLILHIGRGSYVNASMFSSFESALLDIFREHKISIDGIKNSSEPKGSLQVVSTMGLSGDLQGNIIFGCSLASAQAIVESLFKASNITPQDKDFGDLQKATIGEFSNQITGRALMHLSRRSIDCNMTPPTVITGNWVSPDLCAAVKKYSSRVEGSFGSLVLQVGFKESKKRIKNC
jgi:chemotaxis protein CheX